MTKEQKEERLQKLRDSPPKVYKQVEAALVKNVTRKTIRNNERSFDRIGNLIVNNKKFKDWQPKGKKKDLNQ